MTRYGIKKSAFFASCFLLVSAILIAASAISAKIFISEAESAGASAKSSALPVIIIDAGHGGRDGGASADDGTLEKDLNLAVSKKLQSFLESAGYTVVMTRTEDVALGDENSSHKKLGDLKARTETAKKYENAIFISIHMNKFPVAKYSGLTVYYSKNTENSKTLAASVKDTVRNYLQKNNEREVKAAGSEIYVLDNAPCTAILIECGFLSNPEECALLKIDSYQQKTAACIYAAAVNYICKTTNTEEVK